MKLTILIDESNPSAFTVTNCDTGEQIHDVVAVGKEYNPVTGRVKTWVKFEDETRVLPNEDVTWMFK